MNLPESAVKEIWARLQLVYGRDFLSQYEGIEDLAPVHLDWGMRLGRFVREDGSCPAIDHALDNLPAKRSINAAEFTDLCKQWRGPTGYPLGLPSKPEPVPARVREAFAQLAMPIEDKRPEAVRIASRLIAKWGCPGLTLSPSQREWLDNSRKVMRNWELGQEATARNEAAYAQRNAQ